MSEKTEENSLASPSVDILGICKTPKQLESLMEISSSSVNSNTTELPLYRQQEVERIVQKTLKEFKNKGYFNDIDENKLMSLIVSKVLIELQVNDQLYDEMQGIKQTLNSYIQHSRAKSFPTLINVKSSSKVKN
ncbi:uncharacterized protein LOC133850299 [Drosophila sulfurigaster albostrigata]|uniref:uncharacterized protein LOC133850299 n=1 Tax=Drosophila sulfurigaster albostrigata TaxID=89887 RepID=UPI002D21BF87|nr:uncharacterized protein LOC133850299 [Drosophila sulfurigaster albostrigata]